MTALTLWRNANLATLHGSTPWGWMEDGALLTQGDRIVWVGEASALPATQMKQVEDEYNLGGALLTPGLVDCHTHLVYGGQRAAEFEQRLQGASYEAIARAGGGIRSTVAATRAASDEELLASATRRAQSLMAEGVTTVEIKSGYGLSEVDEARCLRVARTLGQTLPLTVRTTYLGAHAVPPEFAGRTDDYVDAVCAWMPALQAEGLVDAVDAFCENIGFTPAQTRRVFEAARALGLPVKLHAEQLSDQGGAALAAEFGALSCDHLEHLSESGIRAMQAAGTVAVLLPGAYYFLRDTQLPPIAALRAHGVPMAIATDHNPGTSPGLSLLLMLNMACTLFRLTPEEALRGATVHGARALGLHDRGTLAVGQRADFCVWDLEHPNELAYWFGHNPCRRTVVGGLERT
ncbi:MAG: imidazolonepropionase [Curvibacter sp. RIFCSPHIGHO2_12_FULL_63_18]|uniref:imidazolonepropionase n=1 Tax=Rhodoferax sp. TaxID=50421 RepID=UPI0008C30953|nr:imidazolonepropionase [Rhodoferax sp.]OGO98267.1 MAG: imidazolonepropionase [Curvibacter sp. GWA2_63_95]OGP06509.1 MAG: imidazolonepropionase [Curvibacter sp. RIFCSPHIGHO2_12_FULL_63_18]HCX82953.1 imidazolonepropionase [Rhodoferax sp.]